MLRWFQLLLCLGTLFVVSGCQEEVKEIPTAKTDTTPKFSEKEKKKLMDGENKRNEEALKQKNSAQKKKTKKKKS